MVVQRIAGEENHPNRSAVCLEITRVAGNQSEKLRIKPLHPGDVPHENPDMAEMNGWSRTHGYLMIAEKSPSPSGRGQGEGVRICRNSDPHPTLQPAGCRVGLSQRERLSLLE